MAEVERYLNVDTFVDYFIINEFFMNHDAGLHSTYLHQQIGGTLEIGLCGTLTERWTIMIKSWVCFMKPQWRCVPIWTPC